MAPGDQGTSRNPEWDALGRPEARFGASHKALAFVAELGRTAPA